MQDKQKITPIDYVLMYLLVGISSMPFLIGDAYLILGFLLTTSLMLVRRKKVDFFIIGYTLMYVLLFLGHVLLFEEFDLFITLAFMLRILYAYMTVKLLGDKIAEVFLRMMKFFAFASLIIWVAIAVFPPFYDLLRYQVAPVFYPLNLHQDYYHIFIFTMNIGEGFLPRNPGAFWEPGGFGVFLNLALLLEVIGSKKLFSPRGVLFILAILTTQSTGTYISFFLILVFYYTLIRPSLRTLIAIPLIGLVVSFGYEELPFMKSKIESRVNKVDLDDTRFQPRTRVVAAIEDWKTFKDSPLIGRGRYVKLEQKEVLGKQLARRSNGTSQYFAVFGLLGVLIYFGSMYYSFLKYNRFFSLGITASIGCILIVMVIGFSQAIFFKPFFMAFSFFFIFAPRYSSFHHRLQQVSKKA